MRREREECRFDRDRLRFGTGRRRTEKLSNISAGTQRQLGQKPVDPSTRRNFLTILSLDLKLSDTMLLSPRVTSSNSISCSNNQRNSSKSCWFPLAMSSCSGEAVATKFRRCSAVVFVPEKIESSLVNICPNPEIFGLFIQALVMKNS